MGHLRVNEIFFSLQGEATRVGLPTVFVRLTGCPLRCHWCDTAHAFHEGQTVSISEIVAKVRMFGAAHVCVTGGEPLAQKACPALLVALCDEGLDVSLETSGALSIVGLDPRVARIVDVKPPASGEVGRFKPENIADLRPCDELKFVLADRTDYEWACTFLHEQALIGRCTVLFSPVTPGLAPALLAQWILDDRLPVRFQMQLHKWLWSNERGR
jgi:7-carboxy-7-deazaguanine synthase